MQLAVALLTALLHGPDRTSLVTGRLRSQALTVSKNLFHPLLRSCSNMLPQRWFERATQHKPMRLLLGHASLSAYGLSMCLASAFRLVL